MNNPKMKKWERSLKEVFDKVDDHLEDKYGELYPLHPARPERGRTANKEHDGLFNVGAAFSAGYGSKFGRGWVVDVRMVTLSNVDNEIRNQIYEEAAEHSKKLLQEKHPEKDINVERDGNVFKIFGDLDLHHH